jgi:hypothetical protein
MYPPRSSYLNFLLDALGVIADEAVTLGRLTVSQQAFGS